MNMMWYDRIMNMMWKERMTVNHNEIEWLLNRIDEYDWCDMYRAYNCQSQWDRVIIE